MTLPNPDSDHNKIPVTGIRKIMAKRMVQSTSTIPHFFMTIEVDTTSILEIYNNAKHNLTEHISVTDILIKVIAIALEGHPIINSRYTDENIILLPEVNIGVATATDYGLVVPVVANANRKDLSEISKTTKYLYEKARTNKLDIQDVQGATFTISNLGMYGIDFCYGIITPPQCGIITIGEIKEKPIILNGEIRISPMVYINLSGDHRILDGAKASQFLKTIKTIMLHPKDL